MESAIHPILGISGRCLWTGGFHIVSFSVEGDKYVWTRVGNSLDNRSPFVILTHTLNEPPLHLSCIMTYFVVCHVHVRHIRGGSNDSI